MCRSRALSDDRSDSSAASRSSAALSRLVKPRATCSCAPGACAPSSSTGPRGPPLHLSSELSSRRAPQRWGWRALKARFFRRRSRPRAAPPGREDRILKHDAESPCLIVVARRTVFAVVRTWAGTAACVPSVRRDLPRARHAALTLARSPQTRPLRSPPLRHAAGPRPLPGAGRSRAKPGRRASALAVMRSMRPTASSFAERVSAMT